MFAAVEYIDLPRHLGELELDEPGETDTSIVNERLGKQVRSDSIFVIKSENRRYHVVAASLKITENELEIFDSPFV